jgi:hypothetical protein
MVQLNVQSFQVALQRLTEASTRPLAVSDLTLYMADFELAIPTVDDWKQFWTLMPVSLQRLDMQKFSMVAQKTALGLAYFSFSLA